MVLNPAFIFVENKSFTLCVRLPIYLFPSFPEYPDLPGEGEARSGISGISVISVIYAASFATNNASGLMLSNCVPKYMVATYDTRNGSYFSISTFSSARPLP